MAIKILYAGSPFPSAKTLEQLYNSQSKCDFQIVGVLTNPPSAKGRHKELTPTPVGEFARKKNLPVFEFEHLDSNARDKISFLNADLLVCFAYGHIFGPKFLSLFKMGGINLHPSLLPKYRGSTPIPNAILNRDKITAISVQTLSIKMDEGDILAQQTVELNGTETTLSLLDYTAEQGAELLEIVISQCAETGKLPKGIAQNGEATYTHEITKNDAKINWQEKTEDIESKIRAYYPEPCCWTTENNLPLKILAAKLLPKEIELQDFEKYKSEKIGTVVEFSKPNGIFIKTGDGILCVTKLQRQGKNAMNYKDFINGARNFVGTVLQ